MTRNALVAITGGVALLVRALQGHAFVKGYEKGLQQSQDLLEAHAKLYEKAGRR